MFTPFVRLAIGSSPFNKVGRLEFENMLLYQRLKTLQDNDNRIGSLTCVSVRDFLTINIEADDI